MLKLSASLTPDSLTLPILQKAIAFDGIALRLETETSVDKNSKKMLAGQFDIAEMSFATFIRARMDDLPFIALPIFTGRRFVQPAIYCSPTTQIRSLSDLIGKRVGLPQFWMTSSVWHRGILQDYYGVPQDRIRWVTVAAERLASLSLPTNFEVVRMQTAGGVADLIKDQLVDCVMLPKSLRNSNGWVNPFDALEQEQIDYYRASRIFPIMHLVVMSAPLAARYPDLPSKLLNGFIAAKRSAEQHKPIPGLADEESAELFGPDPWPYGITENWRSISAFLDYARQQELISRVPSAEELFAETHP